MAVAVGHGFVRLLGRGVQADRVIRVVPRGKGHGRVQTIHGTGRGKDKMLHRMSAAALQQIGEADEV